MEKGNIYTNRHQELTNRNNNKNINNKSNNHQNITLICLVNDSASNLYASKLHRTFACLGNPDKEIMFSN